MHEYAEKARDTGQIQGTREMLGAGRHGANQTVDSDKSLLQQELDSLDGAVRHMGDLAEILFTRLLNVGALAPLPPTQEAMDKPGGFEPLTTLLGHVSCNAQRIREVSGLINEINRRLVL